ncbi:MAG TPA: hypothetical protein VKU00_15335 [Chthonomonadaceae bacterium]|nr:hypothetical protein [Chthonomonadaceae bacterium]
MTTRPGGVLTSYDKVPSEQRPAMRRDAYVAYLRKIGHAPESDWAQQELDAGPKTRAVLEAGMTQSILGGKQLEGLFQQWTLNMLLLINALELLILGGAMLLLTALRRDTGNTPLMVALMLFSVFVILALAGPFTHWVEAFMAFHSVVQNLSGTDTSPTSFQDMLRSSVPIMKASVLGLSLMGPLLALLILGFLRLVRSKEPGSVVASGLRTGGLAAALILMAVYGATLFVTLQKEAQANSALDRILQSEPRYLAELQGRSWPP